MYLELLHTQVHSVGASRPTPDCGAWSTFAGRKLQLGDSRSGVEASPSPELNKPRPIPGATLRLRVHSRSDTKRCFQTDLKGGPGGGLNWDLRRRGRAPSSRCRRWPGFRVASQPLPTWLPWNEPLEPPGAQSRRLGSEGPGASGRLRVRCPWRGPGACPWRGGDLPWSDSLARLLSERPSAQGRPAPRFLSPPLPPGHLTVDLAAPG